MCAEQQLQHLRSEDRRKSLEVARLKQEVSDRDDSLARMEAMHGKLLEARRS